MNCEQSAVSVPRTQGACASTLKRELLCHITASVTKTISVIRTTACLSQCLTRQESPHLCRYSLLILDIQGCILKQKENILLP